MEHDIVEDPVGAQELRYLRGAIDAQDERERVAGERCGVPYDHAGDDWPEAVADKVLELRGTIDAIMAALAGRDVPEWAAELPEVIEAKRVAPTHDNLLAWRGIAPDDECPRCKNGRGVDPEQTITLGIQPCRRCFGTGRTSSGRAIRAWRQAADAQGLS